MLWYCHPINKKKVTIFCGKVHGAMMDFITDIGSQESKREAKISVIIWLTTTCLWFSYVLASDRHRAVCFVSSHCL